MVKLNKFGVRCHSFLTEVTRKNLLGKTKSQSKPRFDRRLNYKTVRFKSVDLDNLLLEDKTVVELYIGDYVCTIQFNDVLKNLKKVLESQPQPNLTLQTVIRAMNKTFDNPDVLVDCTCPDFCLHEDTEIKLLNGEIHTIKDILDKFKNNEEIWVYSTDENGNFKPGEVKDVWVSGYVTDMIKITLDNGESIITTPNHRYMLRNGSYCRADELKEGTSLMPYNHKVCKIEYLHYDKPIPVYDLTVDKYNNFYVNSGVILHNCYRFAYWASEFGYKYGKPETRPSKITNPDDLNGAMCKHLTSALSNKSWIPKVAQQVNKYCKEYPEFVADILDLPEDYIIINNAKIPKGSKWNPKTQKYELPGESEENADERIELEEP